MTETFKLSKSTKYFGLGSSVFFLITVVGSCIAFTFEDPNEHNTLFITIFVANSIMLLACFYTLSTYYVERLVLSRQRIAFRSVFQKLDFDASDLEAVQWKLLPAGGNIVFKVSSSKARLHLGGYHKMDRLRIIRAIHKLAPVEVQIGWPLFCHKVALPLRDGMPSIVRTKPSTTLFRVTRKRYDWMLLVLVPLLLALSITAWAILRRVEGIPVAPLIASGFATSFLIIPFWLLLRFSVPPEGAIQVPIHFSWPTLAQYFIFIFAGFSIALPSVLVAFGIEKSTAVIVAFMPLIIAFIPMFYSAHKVDKQRRLADEQATDLALSQWEQGEIAIPLADHS